MPTMPQQVIAGWISAAPPCANLESGMKLAVQLIDPTEIDVATDALLVGVYEDFGLSPAAAACDRACGGALTRALERKDASGRIGAVTRLLGLVGLHSSRVVLVGLGEKSRLDAANYLKVLAEAAKSLKVGPIRQVASHLATLPIKDRDAAWALSQHILQFSRHLYRYQATRPRKATEVGLDRLLVATMVASATAVQATAMALADGITLCRELGNLPPNICTPQYLADTARRLATELPRFTTEVLESADMEQLGMGALLGVARGSAHPPKLIVMKYQGAADGDAAPYVLVGKGITFDTGGISLKPGAAMDEMKYDMCGGAAVLGVLQAVAQMALPLNVIGVVPAVENMPDGAAYRPGDVLTAMSGQTIEVLNTDAEGRLILCDALSYAKRFKPRTMVDIATLTGACMVALGKHAHGLMTHQDKIADELLAAGAKIHDRAWRLPLWEDYYSALNTDFADLANIGGKHAGAITAACFLSRFVGDLNWAHLDIAGTAWDEGRKGGATGRPVALLVQWLQDRVV